MSYATQTNTQQGDIVVAANEDLTGMEGRLALVTSDSGTPEAKLPDDVADRVLYVILEGAAAGENVVLRPLTPDRNVRVYLDGTCVPGDRITLAAIDGTKDGKAVELPADADDYFVWGIAEESGAAGQLVLVRPYIAAAVVTVT